MSYSVILPIFFLVNGIGFHHFAKESIPIYKTLPYNVQQESIARWNSLLTQMFLIVGSVFANTKEEVDFLSEVLTVYLFTDTIHMLFYYYDILYYVHHCIPLIIFYLGNSYFTPEEAVSIFMGGIILELSNPPISVAWFLNKLGYKSKGMNMFKFLVYLNFFFVRLVYFPYFWYTSMAWGPKIVLAPFHFLNIYWFTIMTKYIVKSLRD